MEVRFFNGGYCRQWGFLVDRRTWRFVKFHAVFVAIRHPVRGWVLIDTGYSDHFVAATRAWPWRLYAWATPASSNGNITKQLAAAGIDPRGIKDIILTHLHADHVGGVRDFPGARFHLRDGAWQTLRGLPARSQLRRAFVPGLFPEDFAARLQPVPGTAFRPHPRWRLPVYDVFGDDSLQLIDLPGHALGHLGVLWRDDAGDVLYAADAYWHWRQIEEGAAPLWPATLFMEDTAAYATTVNALRQAHRAGLRLLACHCPRTQQHVLTAD